MDYEISETSPNIYSNDNTDIVNIMNDVDFFSDFKDEFNLFDNDNVLAQQIDYSENYTLKMLHHVANYYKIPKRKLKKEELIELIIHFENDPENTVTVYNQKRFLHYINELKSDSYFGKFIMFQ